MIEWKVIPYHGKSCWRDGPLDAMSWAIPRATTKSLTEAGIRPNNAEELYIERFEDDVTCATILEDFGIRIKMVAYAKSNYCHCVEELFHNPIRPTYIERS